MVPSGPFCPKTPAGTVAGLSTVCLACPNSRPAFITAESNVSKGYEMVNAGTHVEPAPTSTSFDWYSEGNGRVVEIGSAKVSIRYIGRKGRRARISITAPAGAVFRASDVDGDDKRAGPSD